MVFAAIRSFFAPEKAAGAPLVETLAPSQRPKTSTPVRAEDYPTPEKYLDGAPIPTYYQFQSNLVADEDLQPGMIRQLEVDKRLTVPTRTHIRFLITGQDVLHCYSIPALGLKADATPGRIC